MGPGAIDLTIEASGAPSCIQIGVHVLKPAYVKPFSVLPPLSVSVEQYRLFQVEGPADIRNSGTYVQVGMGSNMTVKVPFFPVISKQLRILGSFRYGMGDYPLAISLVERGLIDLKPLVTQVVEFEQALEAFETTRRGKDENGKVSRAPTIRFRFYSSFRIVC